MTRCGSGKARHATYRHAKVAAKAYARNLTRDRVIVQSMYAYHCDRCDGWHLTRQAGWDDNRPVLIAPPLELQRWAWDGAGDE